MIDALPLLLGDDGYQISRSVRLRSSASAYFNRTPGSASNRTTWTWSGWVKRGALGAAQQQLFGADSAAGGGTIPRCQLVFTASDQLDFSNNVAGSAWVDLISTSVYRDPSAMYHVVCAVDTTQATAANRVKLYVNGAQITAFSTAGYPAQNDNTAVNSTGPHNIGRYQNLANQYFDGLLTEVNFIDGQALTPSSFGETDAVTGVWKPKKYTGTYGTNGFYLNFSDNSAATAAAIGKDYSGNGNNWTPNNVSVTAGVTYDSMLDVPTLWADGGNGRGNYATLNPLRYSTNGSLSEASLRYSNGSGDNGAKAIATIGIPSGKWYWEGSWISGPSNSRFIVGFASSSTAVTNVSMPFERDGSQLSLAANDIANVAIDFDAGKIWYGKNGVWQASGDPATGANPIQTFTPSSYDFLYPGIRLYGASDGTTVGVVNFGQRPFTYTPPTGFKALHTGNLPDPLIKLPNKQFDATLYTGTGAVQTVSNSGSFQPDLVWAKARSGAFIHVLFDSVRGSSVALSSNQTSAEFGVDTAFATTGFRVTNDINASGTTFVGWQWKKGATPGFDIVTYTGDGAASKNISHSLGVAPSMMIVKSRSAVNNWRIYHAARGATKFLEFTTGAEITQSNIWNNTAPTSSVFTVGADSGVNGSGASLVAYLFSEVAGFSKFGSYTGNGSTDGPFVFCGFRPRFILLKGATASAVPADDIWWMWDTVRGTTNVVGPLLFANASSAEVSYPDIDILSNGFKLRTGANGKNASGQTLIYAAFAENPFKYALAR